MTDPIAAAATPGWATTLRATSHLLAKEAGSAAASEGADPVDTLYPFRKTRLRILHETLASGIEQLGPHESVSKETYVSLF